MPEEILLRRDKGAIAHLTLNNPDKLNALSEAMLGALIDQFTDLKQDKSIRVVVLSGAGKAFCAGHDLKEMTKGRQAQDGGKAYFQQLFATCASMMMSIRSLPQPVIAKVHGIATAAGCQLVASCDMAVAEDNTRFGVNGVNIGLFCSTPMVALSRNIPTKQAFEMLTTGQFISADKACDLGLINHSAPHEELDGCTEVLAETVAAKLGLAVIIGKEAFYNQLQMPLADAYAYTGDIMAQNMLFRDTQEGVAAFLDKRKPTWKQ